MMPARTLVSKMVLGSALCAITAACASSPSATPSPPPPEIHEREPAGPAPLPSGTIYGSGSLPPAEVKKALAARRTDVRQCYHALLEKDRHAAGKVVIRFTISEQGTVADTTVMFGTTLPDETANCIAAVVRSTKFAKPTEGKAVIVYPWEFTPDR